MKAQVGEVSLAYDRTGAGPPVLLVMGLAAGRAAWVRQVSPLSVQNEIIAFDNRGAGESDSPPGPWTIEDMVGDTVGLMDVLGLERVHLVGASNGGIVCQEIALHHAPRVLTLTLISGQHGGPSSAGPSAEVMADLRAASQGNPEAAVKASLHSFGKRFRQEHPEEMAEFLKLSRSRVRSPEGLRNQIFASVAWSSKGGSTDRLGSMEPPTLILHGGADEILPVSNALSLAEKIPGARLRIWEDAGHALFFEEAAEVNEELLRQFSTGRQPVT